MGIRIHTRVGRRTSVSVGPFLGLIYLVLALYFWIAIAAITVAVAVIYVFILAIVAAFKDKQ